MLTITYRPIDTWPRPWTRQRRNSPFQAGYRATVSLLTKELGYLNAKNVVLQLALRESDIRQDGLPRANARKPEHPGVLLNFDSKFGPLRYCCDEFWDWESNLRGITLTLERLRMADLYGVTKQGEQYRGWQALPPAPDDAGGFPAVEEAAQFLSRHGSAKIADVLTSPSAYQAAYRNAARNLHPDNGGSHEAFLKLQAAAALLKQRHGL